MTERRRIVEASSIRLSVDITSRISPVELIFYTVTADQMDLYADLGSLVNVFLALFGVAGGAAIGFLVAVKQGGLSPENNATLTTAMWASVAFAVVALACTGWFYYRQRQCKKAWFTSRGEV